MRRRKPWQTEESLRKHREQQAARRWKDPRKMDKSLVPDPNDPSFRLDLLVGWIVMLSVPITMIAVPVTIAYDSYIYYTRGESSGVFDGFPSNAGRRR